MCLWALGAIVSGRGEDLSRIATSPFLIEEYVRGHKAFNAGDLWKALGVPELVSDPRFPDLTRGFDCQSDLACEASIQPLQLSPWNRSVALRFTKPMAELNRYLVFQQPDVFPGKSGAWALAGYIDSGFAKYFDPVLYTRQLGGKWWLVLSEQSGSGTGFDSSLQRWFEVKHGRLREVLSLLDKAYLLAYPDEFNVRPAGILTDYQRTATGEAFRGVCRVAFTLADDDAVDRAFLGSTERAIVYRRNRDEDSFHLSGADGAPCDNIPGILLPDSNQELATWFLRQDFENLRKIARGRQSVEKQWLRDSLKDFPATAERDELIRMLRPHQTRRAAMGSIRVARRAGM